MAYDISNIPLTENSLVEFDLSGNHDFAAVSSMTCQLGNTQTSKADYETVTISDRCGNRAVRSTGKKSGADSMTINMLYVDPIAATADEYDDILAAEGNTIAVRVYPAGKTTNARYSQIIGPLKNVSVPDVGASDADFSFSAAIEGVVSVAKAA